MSTRSSARNLCPPLDDLELTIQGRSHVDPTLLNDFEMATNENGDPPVPDLQTMEELCQPTLNGQGGPIASIAIQATNFGLKNDMIQQVQNSCQFHGLLGDDANKHLDKFLHVTQSIKVNGVTDDALHLHRDTINVAAGGTFMKRRLEECYDLIENMTAHYNYWDTTAQWTTVGQTQNVYATRAYQGGNSYQPQGASHGPNPPLAYQALAYQDPGLPSSGSSSPDSLTTNMTLLTNSNLELKNMFGQFMKMNTASSSGSGTLPSNTITKPKEDLKGITTRSQNAYQGPTVPTKSSSLPQVLEREIEVIKDTVPPTNNGSTKDVQPPVVQIETPIPISEPIVAPVSALKPNSKPSIPYPSKIHDQKLRDKANDQKDKIFQIFQDLNLNISFADAHILMPKFGLTIKSLLTNKDKLFELARTLLNDHCLAVLLKKLPEKLGEPGKFLIPFVTFNLDQTSRYSANYNDMTANQIDVIDMACEGYSQEVLGFSDVIASGNPTPYYDPIVSTSSPTLTPFGDSDFLLEEVDAFLTLEDDPTLLKVDHSYYDKEGTFFFLNHFLIMIHHYPLPLKEQDDFKPAVQHQRRVNLKIHEVIKKEVLKLLDAGLIYPISDSPWVSPVHCVPKKGGFIVLENEEHELIPTRLVTGWREKGHFMVKEGIVLGHKISKNEIKVDKANVDVICKLPHPTTIKESVKDISVAVKWGAPSLDASYRRRARDGAESNQWSEFCSMLDSITLSSSLDRIFCDLNGEATRWVKTVPIKVNILAWRTRLDHLPTRVNLITRGVNIDSSLCPVCSSVQEDSNHLFFLCDLGKSISQRICRCWNIQWAEVSTYAEWNRVVFDSSPPRRAVIFDDIVATSFIWSVNRCFCSFSWKFWLKNPFLLSL
nr:RNA-directed DNA polymerase, eukaryota [Tanacetum cinerariifolium]